MTQIDESKLYNKYAIDVVEGKIVACQAIILACKRYISWFERDDIYFDYEEVDKKIKFISLMKHSTGQHNGKPFILLPWQSWCVGSIFGWKYKDTGLRVTNSVFIMISRKAGKTAFAAALGLCCAIADKENNAEIELVANSRQQANIAFKMCYNFAESLDPKKKSIRRKRSIIEIPKTKSSIQVLSSDAMGNDGYNSSCFILDEMHAAKNWDLYNVMKSSQGMRQQPLAIVITTAGFLLAGYPCYEYRETCLEILKGLKTDDSQFAAIYELDEGDDWQDEKNWLKCAPSLGQTVTYKYLRDQVQSAINIPSQEVGVKTKNFNLFCQSSDVWLPDKLIADNMAHIDIAKLQNETCYMGVDLSAVSDLTCTSVMWPPNKNRSYYPDKYIFKTIAYLPEDQLELSINKNIYQNAKIKNAIQITPGNVVDYDYILEDQIAINNSMDLMVCAYDQWNSTQWALSAERAGINLGAFSQSLGSFNKPTKDFERLLKQGNVIIDDNIITRWCFQNVVLKYDWNDNLKPTKETYPQKIDAVIAMLEALGAYISDVNNADPD